MDFAPQQEPRGDAASQDNPPQEPSSESSEHGTVPVSAAPPNLTVISSASPSTRPSHYPLPLWLERILLFIRVSFAVWIGLFLLGIPWWDAGRAWSENSFLLAYPTLRAFLAQDFIRGLVSGIGLIDIWIGIWWAVHYKEVSFH